MLSIPDHINSLFRFVFCCQIPGLDTKHLPKNNKKLSPSIVDIEPIDDTDRDSLLQEMNGESNKNRELQDKFGEI